MAFQSIWYFTELPEKIIDIIEYDVKQFDKNFKDSSLLGNVIDKEKRNSKNTWIPTTHWLSGFLWHYIQKANRENFLYDLTNIDGETVQYTQYNEGEYYKWHSDCSLASYYKPQNVGSINRDQDFVNENGELIRKLSFVLQISNPDDYEGGNLQIMQENGKSYIAPRQRGTLIFFDSRSQHRVQRVTSGVRKSIVGWVVGPRWK
jgi:PKHD-type hydroxylase